VRVPWSRVGVGPDEAPRRLGLVALSARDVDDLVVRTRGPGALPRWRFAELRLPAAVPHPWIPGELLDALPVPFSDGATPDAPYERLASQARRLAALPEGTAPDATRARELTRLRGAADDAFFGDGGLVPLLSRSGVLDVAELAGLERLVVDNPDRLARPKGAAELALATQLARSLLSLAPLNGDGAVDEDAADRLRVLRRRARYLEAYASCFGVAELLGAEDDRSRVDVFVSRARDDGSRVLVTGGMSDTAFAGAELGRSPPFLEVACQIPALPNEAVGRVAAALAHLGEWARPTEPDGRFGPECLSPGGAVAMRRPILEGSALAHWSFAELRGDPWDLLSTVVPRAPRFLFAVGVTDGERGRLAREAASGPLGLEPLLRGALRLMTDPFRSSAFA
jgi:hypothetical protein